MTDALAIALAEEHIDEAVASAKTDLEHGLGSALKTHRDKVAGQVAAIEGEVSAVREDMSAVQAAMPALAEREAEAAALRHPGPAGKAGDNGTNGVGITWRGAWRKNATYQVNDAVRWNGSAWIAIRPSQGVQPPGKAWSLMVQDGEPGKDGASLVYNAGGPGTAGGGGAPSGPAGGVLAGTYPDPSFAVDMATQAELDAAIAGIATPDIAAVLAAGHTVAATGAADASGLIRTTSVDGIAQGGAQAEATGNGVAALDFRALGQGSGAVGVSLVASSNGTGNAAVDQNALVVGPAAVASAALTTDNDTNSTFGTFRVSSDTAVRFLVVGMVTSDPGQVGELWNDRGIVVFSGSTPLPTFLDGTADPSAGGGLAAGIKSVYTRTNGATGELWYKTGAADTAWSQVA